jgi:hypothetical protein
LADREAQKAAVVEAVLVAAVVPVVADTVAAVAAVQVQAVVQPVAARLMLVAPVEASRALPWRAYRRRRARMG